MDNEIFAIVDEDKEFIEKFNNYFLERYNNLFECHSFTEKETLLSFGLGKHISVLLIDSGLYDPDIGRLKAERIFLLDEEDGFCDENGNIRKIDRFRNADSIIKEILKECAESSERKNVASFTGNTELYTVFSPVSRSLKTTLAICISQILSDRGRTLFINTEPFSGFNQLFMKKYEEDLSDLLLYMKGSGSNFRLRLQSTVDTSEGFDYIPPAMIGEDICSVESELWIRLIEEAGKSGYESIVLDCGDHINGLFDILKKSSRIFMPARQDLISRAKMNQFEALLHISGYEDVLASIEKLKLPFFENLPAVSCDLRTCELGRYVERIL